MIRFVLSACIILLSNQSSFSQACAGCRYISPLFDSVTVETVKFGRGPRADGTMQDLFMDIYQPYGDTMSNRPVAIFAFGGAFITGSRDDWYVVLACKEIAKSGYVVAAIDYRIYDDIGQMIAEIFAGIPPQQMRIFFRPMQDMRAAVQYMKADYAELGNHYKIDTSMILIGGASSGAMTSLMTAYCDVDTEMAQMGFGSLAPLDALGGFYSTSGLYPDYSWKAAATFNVSGSLVKADWIQPGDVPMILAHGDADQIVPYKEGGFAGLTLGSFNMQGSYIIDSVARARGVCSYLYTMEGKDHPSEDIGIEYLKSVVYRMMLRMHAIVNRRSFCCGLQVEVNPADTLYYETGGGACLSACVANDSGSAQVAWCGIKCLPQASASNIITLEPDTNLRYVGCIAYEGGCQAVALNMVKQGAALDCTLPAECTTSAQLFGANARLLVYPQPATGAFAVEWHAMESNDRTNRNVRMEIFDLAGKRLFSKEIPSGNHLTETIDVKTWAAGSYLLRLSGAGVALRKVVVF